MKGKERKRMQELYQEWANIPKTNPDLLGITFERFLIKKIVSIEESSEINILKQRP